MHERNGTTQLTAHSVPLSVVNKSVATAINSLTTIITANAANAVKMNSSGKHVSNNNGGGTTNVGRTDNNVGKLMKPLGGGGNLTVPPRKPISSVAPTSVVSSSIPKMIPYSPKINRVAPHIVSGMSSSGSSSSNNSNSGPNNNMAPTQLDRPALPPKPNKMHSNEPMNATGRQDTTLIGNRKSDGGGSGSGFASHMINDNLPIKAKPLTIRKQPFLEQPRLKSLSGNQLIKSAANNVGHSSSIGFLSGAGGSGGGSGRHKTEMNLATSNNILFSDANSLMHDAGTEQQPSSPPSNPETQSSLDETDRVEAKVNGGDGQRLIISDGLKKRLRSSTGVAVSSLGGPTVPTTSIISSSISSSSSSSNSTAKSNNNTNNNINSNNNKTMNGNGNSNTNGNGKPKLTRRVSFDPLALLLDASLEGELELVKKTAMQVANASAANDEGITALHNAICAGHFDIVK